MKMEIDKDSAILLGNGINYNGTDDCSWKRILLEIADENSNKDYLKNPEAISYPEFFDAIVLNRSKHNKDDIQKCNSEVKKQICEKIGKWEATERHTAIVNYAKAKEIPILTTNYDMTLETVLFINRKNDIKKGKNYYKPSGKYCHYRYPWNQYYSNKNDIFDCRNNFAIWHIHGFIYYYQSLIIGADDYASVIYHAKNYINNKKTGLYATINEADWCGKNSWLDIFFHKKLYIIGLSLDSQETGLRWLLMQREKFFRKKESKRKETIYNYSDDKELSSGKRFFFEGIGIKANKLSSYDEIYSFCTKERK